MVSVIIPSYNRYDFLINAIDSLRAQTFKSFEVLVINDCSQDERYYNTDWKALGVNYFCTSENVKNPNLARNIGLKNAKYEWIAFLDDDDMWLPEKLEKQMSFMKQHNGLFSYTESYYSEEDAAYIPGKKYKKYLSEQYADFIFSRFGFETMPMVITEKINAIHNLIITSSVVVHKSLIEKVGIFVHEPEMPKWEDWAYWLKCMKHTDCLFLNIPLIFYNNKPRTKYIVR